MMFDNMHGFWNYWIYGMFVMFLIAIYVANDASQFGENGMLWALVVVFMPMMGLLFYLIMRSTWTRSVRTLPVNSEIQFRTHSVPPRREQVNTSKQPPMDSSRQSYETKGSDDRINHKDTLFCTTCGIENNIKATYCISCGTKIHFE